MTVSLEQKPSIDFDKLLVDLSEEIKEPQPLISLSDKPIFTRGNISCIGGRAKSRKSFLVGLLTAQFLDFEDNTTVMIIDTEQGSFHVQKATKRIHRLLEWSETQNNKRLRVFRLRELTTDQRLEFVKSAIEYYLPDLVFIDGIRDILHDFNNIAESSEVINLLMKLSSETNSHICCVLHVNKGDDNLRGHTGTELTNKSETTIAVEKIDESVSEVTPKYCRNIAFEKFFFKVNESGLPELYEPVEKPKSNDRLKSLFNELLPIASYLSFADLRTKVAEKTGKVNRTAERYIKEATDTGIIVKNNVNMYYSFFNNDNSNTENEPLPF